MWSEDTGFPGAEGWLGVVWCGPAGGEGQGLTAAALGTTTSQSKSLIFILTIDN